MIETLAARVKLANKQIKDAFAVYQSALKTYPQHRALVYDYIAALSTIRVRRCPDFISKQSQIIHDDINLYRLEAKAHAALGNHMLQHRAQAEIYIQEGKYHAAIEQLEIALRMSNGNFYQLSSVEARLRQLKEFVAAFEKD